MISIPGHMKYLGIWSWFSNDQSSVSVCRNRSILKRWRSCQEKLCGCNSPMLSFQSGSVAAREIKSSLSFHQTSFHGEVRTSKWKHSLSFQDRLSIIDLMTEIFDDPYELLRGPVRQSKWGAVSKLLRGSVSKLLWGSVSHPTWGSVSKL